MSNSSRLFLVFVLWDSAVYIVYLCGQFVDVLCLLSSLVDKQGGGAARTRAEKHPQPNVSKISEKKRRGAAFITNVHVREKSPWKPSETGETRSVCQVTSSHRQTQSWQESDVAWLQANLNLPWRDKDVMWSAERRHCSLPQGPHCSGHERGAARDPNMQETGLSVRANSLRNNRETKQEPKYPEDDS